MSDEKPKWKRVPVPRELMDKVDEIYLEAGYASASEFVRAAVRERLRDLKSETSSNSD